MQKNNGSAIMSHFKQALIASVLSLFPLIAAAMDYVGPEEMLSLSWGKGDNEFDMQVFGGVGPGWEWLPKDHNLFSILEDGTIVLIDRGNMKLKYFKDRVLQKKVALNKALFEQYQEHQMEKCKEVKWETQNSYTGKTTVACGDKTYVIPDRFIDYVRDGQGNFYGINRVWLKVTRYDSSGKMAGSLDMNESQHGGRRDAYLGGPVLAPNGDAYYWKSTPDRFSILRWVWRGHQALHGRPDTPRYVEAHPGPEGIAIRWWFPFQNQESITAFEILRSEKSGTPPYTPVGIVQRKDITGFTFFLDKTAKKDVTYYYRMRTISGDNYSVYSNEAIARR